MQTTCPKIHSNLRALTETSKQTFKMAITVKTLLATHILECPECYGSGRCASALKLTMISDENENKFLMFLIVYYQIDPNFMTLYGKKTINILTNFTQTQFLRQTRKIAQIQLVQNTVNELYKIFDLPVI